MERDNPASLIVVVLHDGGTRQEVEFVKLAYGSVELRFGLSGSYRFDIKTRRGLGKVSRWCIAEESMQIVRDAQAKSFADMKTKVAAKHAAKRGES